MNRPTWDKYFLKMAMLVGERSTCRRRKIGAVLVRDKQIISTGYNGNIKGCSHCLDIGCLRDYEDIESGTKIERCRAVHAEQNAIIQAHRDLTCATIYVTATPCRICASMLANAGIERYVTFAQYPDELACDTLKKAEISLDILSKPDNVIKIYD